MKEIWIIGDFTYPYGSAASARVKNLSEALVDKGYRVKIVALANTGHIGASDGHGVGISYTPTYSRASTGPNASLWGKLKWFYSTYRRSFAVFRWVRSAWTKKPDGVIYYGRSYLRLRQFIRWLKRLDVTSAIDIVEINESFRGLGGAASPVYWDWKIGARMFPRLIDGAIAISTYLEAEAKAAGYSRTMVMPSIEMFADAENISSPIASSREALFRIVYLGPLLPREDPDFIVALAGQLAKNYPGLKLQIAGRYEEHASAAPHVARLKEISATGAVELLGSLSNEQLARLIAAADAFLLSRASRTSEIASFPTRLPEFLRTGKLVFVSPVGDIRMYLADQKDVVYINPANPAESAATISAYDANFDKRRSIGRAGYLKAQKVFNRSVYAERVASFLGI